MTVADAEMPCMLSIDDFDTVYTIVNDLRLTDIQVMMSIFYLQENPQEGYAQDSGYAQSPYQQPQGYQQPVYQPQPTYQPAPQQYQRPMSAPTNPAYGHGGYSPRNYGAPARSAGTAAPAAQPKLAPRPEAPAPAASAAEAPVYKVSYDDESQLGQIFNDSGDSKDDGN